MDLSACAGPEDQIVKFGPGDRQQHRGPSETRSHIHMGQAILEVRNPHTSTCVMGRLIF